MAAWVEATTREMGQSLINPDKPSVSSSAIPGDTGKPAMGPKPHLMPKPFALQRNATVRPIRAPKTNFSRELNRAASSEMLFNTTKPGTGGSKLSESLKSGSNGTVNGSNQSAAPKPVPLSTKPDLMAKSKPEPTKSPGSNNQTGPNSKTGVTAEDVKDVQPRSRAKSLGSQEQKILNQKVQGEAAKTDADVKVSSRCWPPRNRLSVELTSKFESPSQPEKEVRRDAETSNMEKESLPHSPSESKPSKPLMEKRETGDEEVNGGSIRRRISLLFDRSTAPQRMDKRDNPPAEISVDIKQRIQNLSLDAPRTRLPSTGAPKSPPFEKTQSTSDEPSNERSSEKPAATEKVPVHKPASTAKIKNSAASVENVEEEEDGVAIPVYRRVGISLDAETKRREEEEKQRKDEQLEKERQQRERKRLLEEERKAREIERQKEEERKRAEEERKLEEEKQRQLEERRKQEEEQKRRVEEERKEEERRRQAEKERERQIEEEKRRIEEEKERLREEERLEKLKKEREMAEEKERKKREEERLRQEREKEERLRKEKEMEQRKRMEEERLKEEERLRQEQEKERLKKEKEMEEERRRIQELERQKEEERLRKERELERIRKEKEMEEERERLQEMERKKEEERLRQEREKERLQKEKEMEEERRRIQELERQREEERLRKERELERIRKEKEMEEERRRIQELERQKEEERLRQERELERIRKEKEIEEERRRIQELERQKEEERLRKERELERLQKEKEMEEEQRRIQEMERQKEEERLRKEQELERIRKEKEMEEERRKIQELERQKEEERLRQERENEMEMETCKAAERLREEVPTSYDLISFDAEEPSASQTLVSAVQAAAVSPLLTEVIYDDFSVKPRRWGTRARRSSTPSPSREPPAASDHSLQPESKSSDPGSQEPCGDQVYVHDLIGFEPEASSPQNSTESRMQTYLFEESKPEDLLEPETQSDGGQLKDGEPEADGVAEQDTENLIGESDEKSENNDTVDDHATQARVNQALQRLTQARRRNTSTDSDTADVPVQEEPEPLPVLESAAPLLDSSVFRSKVDLGKKRSIKRSRPSRAVRQRAGLPAVTEGTQSDWRFCDSTDAKDQCSNGAESESEEEPSRDVTSSPAPSQPKRVPVFPGMDPSALMAQLKRRSGVVETESPTEAQTPPSVPARSPRTPTMSLGPRVLPPVDAKDSGSGSSPSWLLELKSKKRMSQPESEA